MRALCRALQYSRLTLPAYGLQRALYDGAAMAFLTQLDAASAQTMESILSQHFLGGSSPKVGAMHRT